MNRSLIKTYLVTVSLVVVTALWSLFPEQASAHFEPIGYSDVEVKGEKVEYSLFLDPYQLQSYMELDMNTDGYVKENEVLENKEQLIEFVQTRLTLATDAEQLIPEFRNVYLTERGILPMIAFSIEFSFKQPWQHVSFDYNIFFHEGYEHHLNFAAFKENGRQQEFTFSQDNPTFHFEKATSAEATEANNGELHSSPGFNLAQGIQKTMNVFPGLFVLFVVLLSRPDWKVATAFAIGHTAAYMFGAGRVLTLPGPWVHVLFAAGLLVLIGQLLVKNKRFAWMITFYASVAYGLHLAELLKGTPVNFKTIISNFGAVLTWQVLLAGAIVAGIYGFKRMNELSLSVKRRRN